MEPLPENQGLQDVATMVIIVLVGIYCNFQSFSWTATGLSVNIGSGAAGVTVRRQNFRQRPVV